MWVNPQSQIAAAGGDPATLDDKKTQDDFDDFFEDMFEEYGFPIEAYDGVADDEKKHLEMHAPSYGQARGGRRPTRDHPGSA